MFDACAPLGLLRLGIGTGDRAALIAAVVAVLGVVGPARSYFIRTVGRRFDLQRRFERLGVGAHKSFFETVIGEAPTLRQTVSIELPNFQEDAGDDYNYPTANRQFTESLWVDPLFYAQTVTDDDGTVLGFSITTRTRKFAPRFGAPRPLSNYSRLVARVPKLGERKRSLLAEARLGRTCFADVVKGDSSPSVHSVIGARTYSYSEGWSFGNPGHYSDYVFTMSSVSTIGEFPPGMQSIPWPSDRADPEDGYGPAGPSGDRPLAAWINSVRRSAVVTTWTVIRFPLSMQDWPPVTFGPHGDEVRTLP